MWISDGGVAGDKIPPVGEDAQEMLLNTPDLFEKRSEHLLQRLVWNVNDRSRLFGICNK